MYIDLYITGEHAAAAGPLPRGRVIAMASLVQRPGSPTYYLQFYVSGKLKRKSTGTESLQIARRNAFISSRLRRWVTPSRCRRGRHCRGAHHVRLAHPARETGEECPDGRLLSPRRLCVTYATRNSFDAPPLRRCGQIAVRRYNERGQADRAKLAPDSGTGIAAHVIPRMKLVKKNRSNLLSPSQLQNHCRFGELDDWFRLEVTNVTTKPEQDILTLVYANLDAFVKWPQRAVLLWEGRDRSEKYHSYPKTIQLMALSANVPLDGRVNGPAVAAYRIAGGQRPPRMGSNNGWSIHHIYSGKFPYPGMTQTLHAANDGKHCTQSAGLVAVHPIADQLCDEYPVFSWLLRAMAFQKFRYDPDGAFSNCEHDTYGFVGGSCYVVPPVADPDVDCRRASRWHSDASGSSK